MSVTPLTEPEMTEQEASDFFEKTLIEVGVPKKSIEGDLSPVILPPYQSYQTIHTVREDENLLVEMQPPDIGEWDNADDDFAENFDGGEHFFPYPAPRVIDEGYIYCEPVVQEQFVFSEELSGANRLPSADVILPSNRSRNLEAHCEREENQDRPSRKRAKQRVPTIKELQDEIRMLEENKSVSEEVLKKKRNNLACRLHRMKKKKQEEELCSVKTILLTDVDDLKKENKDLKAKNKKLAEFLADLKKNRNMPAKLAKRIDEKMTGLCF